MPPYFKTHFVTVCKALVLFAFAALPSLILHNVPETTASLRTRVGNYLPGYLMVENEPLQPFLPTGYFELSFMPTGNVYPAGNGAVFQLVDNGSGNFVDAWLSTEDGAMWRYLTPDSQFLTQVLTFSPRFGQDGKVFAGVGALYFSPPSDAIRLSSDSGRTWRSSQQPIAGHVLGLAVSPNFAVDHMVYASVYNSTAQLLRSMDGGEHWQSVAHPPRDESYSFIRQIIISPNFATDQTLFAFISSDNALWRSVDGGINWSRADKDITNQSGNRFHNIVIAPRSNRTMALLAATEYALFITLDNGDTWNLLSKQEFSQIAVPTDFAWPPTILGIDQDHKLQRSTDLGQSWTQVLSDTPVHVVATPPNYSGDQTVYARTDLSFLISHNGGQNWVQTSSRPDIRLGDVNRLNIVVSPDFDVDGIAFATQRDDDADWILKSTDGGHSWRVIRLPRSGHTYDLAISPAFATDQTVLTLISSDLYKSIDSGEHWTLIGAPQHVGDTFSNLVRISPNYANDHTIFIGMYGYEAGGIYRSNDDGQSWARLTEDSSYSVTDLDISPGYPSNPTMYFASYNDGIFRSDDNGTTWISLSDPQFSPDFRVTLSPVFPKDNTLFVTANGISDGGAFRSNDRGDTWTDISGVMIPFTQEIAVSPNFVQDQTIVTVGSAAPFYISEDAGNTWFPLRGVNARDTGSYGRKPGLATTYNDGHLAVLVSTPNVGIYRYRWPKLLSASLPSVVSIGLDPYHITSVCRRFFLNDLTGDGDHQVPWGIRERAEWLTATPVTGTLPLSTTLTVDLASVFTGTIGTNLLPLESEMEIDLYWSYRNKETFTVPVRAFFVLNQVWMPLIVR